MRIVGPQTLTVGSANTINDPAESGGNPSAACQIQNSSAYALNVLAEGDMLSIQPFTAQTVEISGQPMIVTPLAGTGTGGCQITFVFLLTAPPNNGVQLPDSTWVESPPQQDGPLTAAAIAASTQGSVDLLGSGTLTFGVSGGAATISPLTALHSYSALVVALTNFSAASPWGLVTAQAYRNVGTPIVFPYQSQSPTGSFVSAAATTTFILPIANVTGDALAIALGSVTALWGTTANYTVFGLTSEMTQQVIAPVGNPLATSDRGGTKSVTLTLTTTSSQQLGAPAPGYAYRLHSVALIGASFGSVEGQLGDAAGSFFTFSGGTPFAMLNGLVVASAITGSVAATTAGGTLRYDVIPVPTVS